MNYMIKIKTIDDQDLFVIPCGSIRRTISPVVCTIRLIPASC